MKFVYPKPKLKFKNKKITIDGILFDSLAESKRYLILKILQKAGKIKNLKIHPKYLLLDGFTHEGEEIRPIYYVSDFEYCDNEGNIHVEDVKGVKTKDYILKKKLFLSQYGKSVFFKEI